MQLWPNHALFIKLFNVSVFCYFCYLGQLWYMSSGDPINTEYTCQMDSGCHFLFWAVMSVPFSSVLLKLLWLCHCVICWLHINWDLFLLTHEIFPNMMTCTQIVMILQL